MKAKRQNQHSPFAAFLIFSMTVAMLSSGAFGLVPNSPFAQQYLDLVASIIPLELIDPVNKFLDQIGAPTIPEGQYFDQERAVPLDPGGWILEQLFGVDLPPINSNSDVPTVDPAGALFETLGIETDTLQEPEIPRDPIGEFASLFGVELEGDTEIDISPLLDPGGYILSLFIKEEYLYPLEPPYNPFLDPGGVLLGLIFPQELFAQPDPFLVYNTILDPIGMFLGENPTPVSSAVNPNPGVDAIGWIENLFSSSSGISASFVTNSASGGDLSFNVDQGQVPPNPSTGPSPTSSPEETEPALIATTAPSATTQPPAPNFVFVPPTQPPDTSESTEETSPAYPVPPTEPPTAPPTAPPPTSAIVNSTADPGVDGICDATECTLREAISLLASGGTITFDPVMLLTTIDLSSVLIINNNLTIDGSGISPTISGNSTVPIFEINGGNVTLIFLSLTNGSNTGDGGAIIFNGGTLTINSCLIMWNTANNGGGIAHNSSGSLTVVNALLTVNTANNSGGGIYHSGAGALSIQRSEISWNQSTQNGGGIYANSGTFINNTMFRNTSTSGNGGALFLGSGAPQLINSTIVNNNASGTGGGVHNSASLTMVNNILWGNNAVVSNPQIYDTGGTMLANNNIQGNGTSGTNIDSDPLFFAGDGGDGLSLQLASPSVNSGDNIYCPPTDKKGNARPVGICDMGAYETP